MSRLHPVWKSTPIDRRGGRSAKNELVFVDLNSVADWHPETPGCPAQYKWRSIRHAGTGETKGAHDIIREYKTQHRARTPEADISFILYFGACVGAPFLGDIVRLSVDIIHFFGQIAREQASQGGVVVDYFWVGGHGYITPEMLMGAGLFDRNDAARHVRCTDRRHRLPALQISTCIKQRKRSFSEIGLALFRRCAAGRIAFLDHSDAASEADDGAHVKRRLASLLPARVQRVGPTFHTTPQRVALYLYRHGRRPGAAPRRTPAPAARGLLRRDWRGVG